MSKVIGNCSKHSGQNMVNCPICKAERFKKEIEQFKDQMDWESRIKEIEKDVDGWGLGRIFGFKETPEINLVAIKAKSFLMGHIYSQLSADPLLYEIRDYIATKGEVPYQIRCSRKMYGIMNRLVGYLVKVDIDNLMDEKEYVVMVVMDKATLELHRKESYPLE